MRPARRLLSRRSGWSAIGMARTECEVELATQVVEAWNAAEAAHAPASGWTIGCCAVCPCLLGHSSDLGRSALSRRWRSRLCVTTLPTPSLALSATGRVRLLCGSALPTGRKPWIALGCPGLRVPDASRDGNCSCASWIARSSAGDLATVGGKLRRSGGYVSKLDHGAAALARATQHSFCHQGRSLRSRGFHGHPGPGPSGIAMVATKR